MRYNEYMRKSVVVGLCVIGLCAVATVSWFGIGWYTGVIGRITALEKENKQLQAKPVLQTDADVISRVSTLLVLPPGEPKIIPVADVETLKKTQPFFDHAENGDKILVYPTKVILYSTLLDKIVEVAVVK
jgi:hypothetical protein